MKIALGKYAEDERYSDSAEQLADVKKIQGPPIGWALVYIDQLQDGKSGWYLFPSVRAVEIDKIGKPLRDDEEILGVKLQAFSGPDESGKWLEINRVPPFSLLDLPGFKELLLSMGINR